MNFMFYRDRRAYVCCVLFPDCPEEQAGRRYRFNKRESCTYGTQQQLRSPVLGPAKRKAKGRITAVKCTKLPITRGWFR